MLARWRRRPRRCSNSTMAVSRPCASITSARKPLPTHGDDRLRLAGTKGIVEYQASTGVTLMTADAPPKILELPPAQSLFIDYLNATYNGKAPTLPVSDIYRICEVTLAAEEARIEGQDGPHRWVEWKFSHDSPRFRIAEAYRARSARPDHPQGLECARPPRSRRTSARVSISTSRSADAITAEQARATIEAIARDVLANPVIENYRIEFGRLRETPSDESERQCRLRSSRARPQTEIRALYRAPVLPGSGFR